MRLCSGGGHPCGGDGRPCMCAVLPRQAQRTALVPAHGCSGRCRHHLLHHHPQVRHPLAAGASPPSRPPAVAQILVALFPSLPLPIPQCHAQYAHSMRGTCTQTFMRFLFRIVTARATSTQLLLTRLIIHPIIWGMLTLMFTHTARHIGMPSSLSLLTMACPVVQHVTFCPLRAFGAKCAPA